jgi:hypothetical protein
MSDKPCELCQKPIEPEFLELGSPACLACLEQMPDAVDETDEPQPEFGLTLEMALGKNQSAEDRIAHTITDGDLMAALIASSAQREAFETTGSVEVAKVAAIMSAQIEALASSPDVEQEKWMLARMAITLEHLSSRYFAKATFSDGAAAETNMKIGRQAQVECRKCLESLAALKRPALKQTNIAHGHQQVINAEFPQAAIESETARENTWLAALEALNRSKERSRPS